MWQVGLEVIKQLTLEKLGRNMVYLISNIKEGWTLNTKLYEHYKKLAINTAPIGLALEENQSYFCTPVGAKIIGWDNGIHYCFINNYEGMIFAVNPESCCDYDVYPIAKNFTDFLKLLLSTKNTNTLQQIILWDKQKFNEFIDDSMNIEYDNSSEVTTLLNTIKTELKITEMQNPFEYVKELQKDFDYTTIQFTNEYYDVTGIEKP